MKQLMPFAIIAGVLVLAFAVATYLYNSTPTTLPGNNINSKDKIRVGSPGADPPRIRNSAEMKVVVEEFGDFQCPICAVVYGEVKKTEKEYGDKITVIFRQMPLPMHKFAFDAARASEAAGMQGRFWEMHDILYEKQKEWSVVPDARVEFTKYAQQLGLDVGRFQSDMVSPMVNSRVQLDVSRGQSLGVSGTPTIFVNGKQVNVNDMNAEGLRKYINEALSTVK